MGSTKLSHSIDVKRYKELKLFRHQDNKAQLADLLKDRFNERFFDPILSIDSKKHGFMMMAVSCLAIEAFMAFRVGHTDPRDGLDVKAFKQFFKDYNSFNVSTKDQRKSFYFNIRCGLLHDGETRSGWKILRRGELYDPEMKTINATKFSKELRTVVENYSDFLKTTDLESVEWRNLIKKFDSIVENCGDKDDN